MIILLLFCCSFSVGVIYHCLITDNIDWTSMDVCVCLCVCAVCCSLPLSPFLLLSNHLTMNLDNNINVNLPPIENKVLM